VAILDNVIHVNGARENNLKNITVKIPRGTHTVIVGVSGSGKSSLAYDVIFAEGQKRLLDCLSETSKFFTNRLKQPDVNFIEGLTPVISVKQYKPPINPRSTIGTLTEINTYMRYLFSAMGDALCPGCNTCYPVMTMQHFSNELARFPENAIIEIQFPVYKYRLKRYEDFFADFHKKGFKQIIIDEKRYDFRDKILPPEQPKSMYVVAGKIQIKKELNQSDINLLKKALQNGDGFIKIHIADSDINDKCQWFFKSYGCNQHQMIAAEITPKFFAFNNPLSACEECRGSGLTRKAVPELFFHEMGDFKHKSLRQINPLFSKWSSYIPWNDNHSLYYCMAKHFGFSFDEPIESLPDFAMDIIFYGTKGETFPYQLLDGDTEYRKALSTNNIEKQIEFVGLAKYIDDLYEDSKKKKLEPRQEVMLDRYMVDVVCVSCNGTRLKPQRKHIVINGVNFNSISDMELSDLFDFISNLHIPSEKANTITPILNEIRSKTNAINNIGLSYLSLNRRSDTLSGGEYQRVRLAGQIGSGLTGLTYIIDEPTVGLHGNDNYKIIQLIERICSKGNTVITIEHDIDIIKSADHIIEVGPSSGEHGGKIIAEGTLDDIKKNTDSVIAPFLSMDKTQKGFLRKNANKFGNSQEKSIKIIGAKANNLKNIDVEIPLNRLVCLTGISGSGKSSLAIEIIYNAFWAKLHDGKMAPGKYECIEGMENISDIYCIDQSAMGLSKTSTPATYIGFFDAIRKVFAESTDAAEKGLNHISHYSYNSTGGCTSCKGAGFIDTQIPYLGNLNIVCAVCEGARYKDDVLDVKYNGKNISEVLNLTVEAALDFFSGHPYIYNKIKCVGELGLSYMTLGQPITTISGGEAQRLRLAEELSKIRRKKNMLYILDEPTTGLHAKDIELLLLFLKKIVSNENTVLLIEHNTDVILNADYIIDMGPGAGKNGGTVVASGSVSDIMECCDSATGRYLRAHIHGFPKH